jgi:hypothetical protein
MSVQKATSFLFRSPASFFPKSRRPATEIFGLPEKWKGGRIEKFVNYWKAVKDDYHEAFRGTFDFKADSKGTSTLNTMD